MVCGIIITSKEIAKNKVKKFALRFVDCGEDLPARFCDNYQTMIVENKTRNSVRNKLVRIHAEELTTRT